MTITIDTVIARSPNVLFSEFGDQTVMMNIESGEYFDLDTMGTKVWEILADSTSVSDVCKALMSKFDVSSAECEGDILAFLNDLLNFQAIIAE